MPRFSSVDVLFKLTTEGWTFNSSYPRMFGPLSTYLLTDAQKAALEERLNRFALMLPVLVFVVVGPSVVALVMVPGFADQLETGSPAAWLLVSAVWIVLTGVLVLAISFIRHRVIEPVLGTARRIRPAQPYGLGILVEIIRRYAERKSARVIIVWIAILFLFSAYNTTVYALIASARGGVGLLATVVPWLATLWYAALLSFKLRARRSRQ